MLILQRKKGESIVIDNNITLSIVEIGTDWVKVAIDAPKEVPIFRAELLEAADANREASSMNRDSILSLEKFLNAEKDVE